MSIPINYWKYNDITCTWSLVGTDDYRETIDEHKYFRVMSNGKKEFYMTSDDYFNHCIKTIEISDTIIKDVNENIIFTYNLTQ